MQAGQRKMPDRFAKFFLGVVDSGMGFVRKILKFLRKENDNMAKDVKTCNCRDKPTCPVGKKCLRSNVVYKATVEYEDKKEQ